MQQLVSRFPVAESRTVLRASNIAATFAVGVAFCILALGCIVITRYDGPIATIWIPNAVVAAFLLHTAQDRQNPLLLIGMFAGSAGANTLAEFPTHHAFLFALANVIEIAIAVRLTRHWCGGRPKMDELDHLARFILAGGIIASASSGWCCQTNRNLSPIGARYPFPELVQAMRFCHSASAAERAVL